jgi:hypothetical protein
VKLGNLLNGYLGIFLIIKRKKKENKEKKNENKALAIMPWSFNLMGIPVNFEILSHCTLELT